MSLYTHGEVVTFKFIFNSKADFYDPITIDPNWQTRNSTATPYYGVNINDIFITIVRGEYGSGGVVGGPYSYNAQSYTPDYGVPITTQFLTNADVKTALENNYITRESEGVYSFVYKIPEKLFPGKYTVVLETFVDGTREIRELTFQVRDANSLPQVYITDKQVLNNVVTFTTSANHNLKKLETITISGVDPVLDGLYEIQKIVADNKFNVSKITADMQETKVNPYGLVLKEKSYFPVVVTNQAQFSNSSQVNAIYRTLQPFQTNSVLLIGHADSNTLGINEIKRINSLQEAVDTFNANRNSPLLRAVFDCHAAGCTDIYVMISAPMLEYVEDQTQTNQTMPHLLSSKSATPTNLNFYQKYYERLEVTYSLAKIFDFIDIVVPVGVSFIRNSGVKFVRQLADFCSQMYVDSSSMTIGIIGSRTVGINPEDITAISDPLFLENILKDENGNDPDYSDLDGNVLDIGRHVMLFYGEAIFSYPQLSMNYTNSVSAAVAGQLSNWPVYQGMNRQILKGAYAILGSTISSIDAIKLDNSKVNTLIKSNRSRRGVPFQVFISNDRTLAKDGSAFANIPQVRLAAMVINQAIALADSAMGKFSYDIIKEKMTAMFDMLKFSNPSIIRDYRFEMFADKKVKGKIYLEIDLISSHALKRINFNLLAGPRV